MSRIDATRQLPAAALRAMLGEDLWTLVAALPAGLRDVATITNLRASTSARASFRIALEDGTLVKGRRLDSDFEAERLTRLSRHLRLPFLPAVVAQRGAAVIEPWIEGKALTAIGADDLRACGASLGSIHISSLPSGSAEEIVLARRERATRLGDNLRKLVTWRRIDEGCRARIEAAATPAPAEPAIGLIHGDFCPDNLVRTDAGTIVAIDNETLRFEALDYDLARCWYRWPMDNTQRDAFLAGYAERRSPKDFLKHFSYWAICALVDSAVFRIGAGVEDGEAVLRQLKRFVSAGDGA